MTTPAPKPPSAASDLRGAARLAVHATKEVTDIVERMHLTIGGGPAVLGAPLRPLVRFFTAPVYASVRGVTDLVGRTVDGAIARVPDAVGASPVQLRRLRAVLNGVVGDHLADSGNPLALPFELRVHDAPLPLEPELLGATFPEAGGRVVVLVHGSSMDAASWARGGHDHGAALERDLGWWPVAAQYNTGRHVHVNGRELAEQLEALVLACPRPVTELVLLGFSMGGLVARSAVDTAARAGLSWRRALSAMVFLGTPHHGAPLEQIGSLIGPLLEGSRYSAPLGRLPKLRSAGVTDLRYGNVVEDDVAGRDRFAPGQDQRAPCPLPEGVRCIAIAGTTRVDVAGGQAPEDVGALGGDGLVPVASALGRHPNPDRRLAFPPDGQWLVPGTGHIDLLASTEAYARVRDFLAGA